MAEIPAGRSRQDRYGFIEWRVLPAEGWDQYWTRIFVADDVKRRLFNYARFVLAERASHSIVGLPVHGIALLRGVPGTGKSSLVKGLAQQLAADVIGGDVIFAEVDAHALPSQMLGESQRNTATLLTRALPELAAKGHPLVVLIDEVDSLAMDRHRATAGTDPVDVARATEAALQGLDHLADEVQNMVILTTSNFPQAIDPAFLSRLDMTFDIELPDRALTRRILVDVLDEVGADLGDDAVSRVADAVTGISGRDIRKSVFEALIVRDSSIDIDAPLTEKELWASLEARLGDGGDR